ELKVRAPADTAAPVVSFELSRYDTALSALTNVVATVADVNLDFWRLEIAPLGSSDFVQLATGSATVNNATLTQLDPTKLPNGFYRLRLTARDVVGRTSTAEVTAEIKTATKPSAYRLTDGDLTGTPAGRSVHRRPASR